MNSTIPFVERPMPDEGEIPSGPIDRRRAARLDDILSDRMSMGGEDDSPSTPGSMEKALQSEIADLIAQKRTDEATKRLIDQIPALKASGLNIKEALNTLYFSAKQIQAAGGLKYGVRKLLAKANNLSKIIEKYPVPQGGFVELGCGAHDPIALSTHFYVNGFSPNYAVDLLAPRTPAFTALSMYDIIANMRVFPGRYARNGTKPIDVLNRLRDIDIQAFERGDFEAGLASLEGKVNLELMDIVKSRIAFDSISMLSSFAVLEHVDDIDSVSSHIFKLLKPGGLAFHFVDLADHRSYRGDKAYGPLSFLTEEQAPPNMNRLRAPQITEAQVRAGFEVLDDVRIQAPSTVGIREALVPRFRHMQFEDVTVIKQRILVRKPG